MKNFVIVAVFIVFVLNACKGKKEITCDYLSTNHKSFLNNPDSEFNSKNIDLLTKIIAENKNCKHAYAIRGDIFFSKKRFKDALRDYLTLVRIDSNNVYGLFEIGFCYEAMEKFDSAIVYYDKAAAKKSTGSFVVDIDSNLGNISSERIYDVSYPGIIFRRGISYYSLGKLKDSYRDISYCIKRSFMLAEAYYFRGLISYLSKNQKKSCEDFKKAIDLGNSAASESLSRFCK